jgi:hypothetical protein
MTYLESQNGASGSARVVTFRFSNKILANLRRFGFTDIFLLIHGATIFVAATLLNFARARVRFGNTSAYEVHPASVRPSYGVGSIREGQRGSEWGYSTFSRYFNALEKANCPDRGPIAAALLRSFCPDATAARRPLPRSIPSP